MNKIVQRLTGGIVRFPLLGALLVVGGCASGAELDTLNPKGPDARLIDGLSDPVFIVAGIVFLIVFLREWKVLLFFLLLWALQYLRLKQQ